MNRTLSAVACFALSAAPVVARDLSFEERVRAQDAIERVYYAHQIGATKPFEQAVPREVIERKVLRYLALSAEAERRAGSPIDASALRREMERIARGTRLPGRLRELYAALDRDPVLVAECLARPALVHRLAADAGGPAPSALDLTHSTEIDGRALGESLPEPDGSTSCVGNNAWSAGALGEPPGARAGNSAVWTGTEWLLWGGTDERGVLRADGFRYDPVLDSWRRFAGNGAPTARRLHAAVWTGERMVVWGGEITLNSRDWANTGGRYDPVSDAWIPTSLVGAPEGRISFAWAWTGSRLVVWGGNTVSTNEVQTGGRYDPVADAWSGTAELGSPAGRSGATAVWVGDRVVVWGGFATGTGSLATGGRYDPVTDTWSATAIAGAPAPRQFHSAVAAGASMLVWGGSTPSGVTLTGGRYDTATDTWTAISTSNAPAARANHGAVWTGTRMLIWGGSGAQSHLGGNYDPGTDSWTPMSGVGAPAGRQSLSVAWTGSRLLVWGGGSDTGGRYDPVQDVWFPVATNPGPPSSAERSTVWTGNEMIVWGGSRAEGRTNEGARYDPVLDAWGAMSTSGAPTPRTAASTVWTGSAVIVWGGDAGPGTAVDSGGRYDPIADSWLPTSTTNAPSARRDHSAVWTGAEMVVWGGQRNLFTNCVGRTLADGARYDPVLDSWTPLPLVDAPRARYGHTAVWTGSRMVVWGGSDEVPNLPGICLPVKLNSGGILDVAGGSWAATSPISAPTARTGHTAVWTGSEMVIWGGNAPDGNSGSGGKYRPDTDAWSPTSLTGSPIAREGHGAVWTGTEMVVWGGSAFSTGRDSDTGARYDPLLDQWTATPTAGAPEPRRNHSAVWADGAMLVWDGGFRNGSRYGVGNPDADADGLADACDACPHDATNDLDGDGICGLVDTCAAVPNRVQLDTDADSIGDLCDNCPSASNVSQSDGDGDGSGDACDCQPLDPNDSRPLEVGTLGVSRSGSSTMLSWAAVGTADGYSVTRGDLATKGAGLYGPCQANGITTTTYTDTQAPGPGQGWYYLVQAQNFDCGMGSLGRTSQEAERVNTSPGSCGGVVVTDTRATGESSVVGTVSGTFAATQSSNDTYEAITEVLSSGGSPSTRFSQLEHRWTVSIGSGSVRQLHVEGFRSSSTDGDDFRFEWSTNATTWNAITMASLPLSDNAIDLIGTLPAGATGNVTIRVVDTNRTAGNQAFDTVTIDELFVRTTP